MRRVTVTSRWTRSDRPDSSPSLLSKAAKTCKAGLFVPKLKMFKRIRQETVSTTYTTAIQKSKFEP